MTESDGNGQGLFFMSVREAKRSIDGTAGQRGGGHYYRAVAGYVLEPKNNVLGSPDEFFNFITSYMRAGDYFTALRLAKRALEIYPYNVDLLASAIQSAPNAGAFDVCADYVKQARTIPLEHWNWRLFLFTIEYCQTCMQVCPPENAQDYMDEALELAREYQRHLPTDERGYDKEAELYIAVNQIEQAKQVLMHAVFDKVEIDHDLGEMAELIAPQCCVTLLDLLGDSTDYELIEKVAQRGIRNVAQDQPSANLGYFVYREALALDAKICGKGKEGLEAKSVVRDALAKYQIAYQVLSNATYLSNIRNRFTNLSLRSGITDMKLE